jgi:hypothetical protein
VKKVSNPEVLPYKWLCPVQEGGWNGEDENGGCT